MSRPSAAVERRPGSSYVVIAVQPVSLLLTTIQAEYSGCT